MSKAVISLKLVEIDSNLKFEIANTELGGKAFWCIQCGMCTSGCPVAEFLKPHRIVRMVMLGLRDQLIGCKEIWLCTTCFTCSERCPQEVDPANIIFSLKNMAAEQGVIPKGLRDIGKSLAKTGRVIKIGTARERERMKLGLPKIPQVHVERNRKILEETSFIKTLERVKR